jgi:hypothetical protein
VANPSLLLRKSLPFLSMIAQLPFTGCTNLVPSMPTASVSYSRPMIAFDGQPRFIARERIDRYVCPNDAPLVCDCFSRLAAECECRCP